MARSDMDGRLEQCVMAYGSTSLFILPIRYRHFIPLLAEIEKEYRPDKVMIIHEINKFIRKNIDAIQKYDEDICRRLGEIKEEVVDGLTKKLDDFAEGLWKSGQTLDFWNIDLSTYKSSINKINTLGIIILEIIVSLCTFGSSILIFIGISVLEIFLAICNLFCLIFKKH